MKEQDKPQFQNRLEKLSKYPRIDATSDILYSVSISNGKKKEIIYVPVRPLTPQTVELINGKKELSDYCQLDSGLLIKQKLAKELNLPHKKYFPLKEMSVRDLLDSEFLK